MKHFHKTIEVSPRGWRFTFSTKPGAGYRWIDFPWHGMSIYDPWWKKRRWISYIPGFTFAMGTNHYHMFTRKRKKFVISLRSKSTGYVPFWWSH